MEQRQLFFNRKPLGNYNDMTLRTLNGLLGKTRTIFDGSTFVPLSWKKSENSIRQSKELTVQIAYDHLRGKVEASGWHIFYILSRLNVEIFYKIDKQKDLQKVSESGLVEGGTRVSYLLFHPGNKS